MLISSRLGQTGRANALSPALRSAPSRLCPLIAPRRTTPKLLPSPRHLHRRPVVQAAATPPAPPAPDSNINFKKGFWTFVDVVAILGSVGGALAAILNLFSGTYVLFLPLVLPVVSLLSALQREGLIAEDNRRAYDTLRVSLTRDSTVLLADARGAIEEVRRELRGQNTTAARLGTIEARLSSLEGSILSAGRSAREAAAGLGLLPERLGAEQRSQLEGLVAALRLELRRAAESLANNETTALARLDARLAAVEGSLSGLEVAQSEGLRRLSMSLNSALADAEATLQSSVRNEVARSMEPVRRLPQMLAVALPPALAAAEAVEASAAGGGPAGGVAGGPPPPAAVTPEQLQAIVGQEVEAAVARILDFQADGFGRLATVRPVPMDDEQWAALGRRLTRLERLVEGVPAGTEGALLQGGQVPAAVAAAVGGTLAEALAEARSEVVAAAAREAEGVRNDLLAAQTVLRESLDGLAEALQPLQLGVTELQLAVAGVTEAQLAQRATLAAVLEAAAAAAEPLAPAAAGGGAAAADLPAPPAAELTRLLEGLEAVAALLRDVDGKMDGVAAAVAKLPSAAAAAAAPPPPPVPPAPDAKADAAAAAAAAEAAAAARQQQEELQAGIESMREALAALTAQVGLMASRPPPAAAAAAPPPPQAAGAAGVIADVLSFEASLTAAAPPERSGDGAASTVTTGTTAAAVAVEAGVSTIGGGGGDDGARRVSNTAGTSRDEAYDMMLQLAEARRRSGSEASSSSGGTTGGGAAAVSAPAAAEPQLRIVGLPPFEPPPATAAAVSELPPLPPSQRELEEAQLQQQAPELPPASPPPPPQQPLLQQQQQQQAPMTWPQAAAEADGRFAAAAAPPPTAPADGLPSPYGGEPVPLSYVESVSLPPYSAASPPSFASSSSYATSSQPSPPPQAPPAAPSPPSYAPQSFPAQPDAGYGQQGEVYGWDQQQELQPQVRQQQQQEQVPYNPYEQPIQEASSQGGFREGPAATFPPDQSAEASPSWYGTSTPPPPPSQQQQQQQQQRFPFWPLFGGSAAAAAAAPPPPPPSQQQQQQQAAAPLPSRAGGSGGSPPSPTPPPITPSPVQQQQQQQPRAAPAAAAPPPPPPPAAAAAPVVDYRPRPLDGMSVNEMISEGLRLLRLGREETRKGEDYGLADTLIQSSIAAFTRASEQPSADTKALGNLGNALLARGELKAAYLEALRSGPPPASLPESTAQVEAERAMTMEANALLTEAGVMFLRVLEQEGWSSRALVNWGRALVIRADLLAATPDGLTPGGPTLPVVAQLYTSAIDKFEGVLEGEPDMVPAKYRCALAMAGMSRTKPPGSRERLTLLADAINYLRDVMVSPSPDAEALRPSAAAALQQYETQLMAQRAARQ
ncbi:hypothetical protein PLESTM_001414800 [Pleodorina starrii]|nr:hypothetical protein PLESTM_001414800 [Pleodorina starrii]